MRPATLLPLLALLCAGGANLLSAQAPAPPVVRSVSFQGVRSLDRSLVADVVETRRGTPLDSMTVRRDAERIEALYDAWGYPAAEARGEAAPRGDGRVNVVFHVVEGAPQLVRSVTVRGLDTLSPPLHLPELPLRAGEPYALPLLDATQRLIATELANRGYAFAQVEVSGGAAPEGGASDVVLDVTPGPVAVFGPVEIQAERPLTERDVRARLAYDPGDRFSPEAMERSRERLFALPVVDSVDVTFAPGPEGSGTVPTRVAVGTGRVTALQGSGGLSSTRCLQGVGWWGSRYFLGAPRTFTLTLGTANLLRDQLGGVICESDDEEGVFTHPDYLVRGELRQPVGSKTWLLADLAVMRETQAGAYVRRGFDGRFGASRELRWGLVGNAAYAPQRTEDPASAFFFCGVYDACSARDEEELTDAATLAPVELGLVWASPGARRVAPGPRPAQRWLRQLLPDRAVVARVSVAAAGAPSFSEFDYGRGLVEGSVTQFVGRRVELAARGRIGGLLGAGDILPPQVRLFGGGPHGVRGAPVNRLGPKLLLLRSDAVVPGCEIRPGGCEGATVDPDDVRVRATGGDALLETGVEGRVWVTGWAQLAGFVDFGTVWSGAEEGTPAAVTTSESLLSPGIGVRLLRPVPLRVDVAYDTSPDRVYPLLASDPAGGFIRLGDVRFLPFGDEGGWSEFGRRLRVQISSGFTY